MEESSTEPQISASHEMLPSKPSVCVAEHRRAVPSSRAHAGPTGPRGGDVGAAVTDRPKRIAFMPAQASDVIVTFRGRERRWLSRMLGILLAPLLRWRDRRRM